MKTKKQAAAKQAATEETPAPEAATKSTKKTKAPAKPKASIDTLMPRAKTADDHCVFALRMTLAERDELHAAAGPSRASRFVRAVALAAARNDVPALQAILTEIQRDAAS